MSEFRLWQELPLTPEEQALVEEAKRLIFSFHTDNQYELMLRENAVNEKAERLNKSWKEIQLRKLGLEPSEYSLIGLFSLNTHFNLGEYRVDTYSESDIQLKYFIHSGSGVFKLSNEVYSIERRIGAKVIPRNILWNADTKWWKLCNAVFGSPYSVEHPREYTEKLMKTRVHLGEDPQPYIDALEEIGKLFE